MVHHRLLDWFRSGTRQTGARARLARRGDGARQGPRDGPRDGHYAASKHAVEGWSDALAAEGAPLGIRVTCVEPGPFRTDWAGRSLKQTPNRIIDYAETAGARLKMTSEGSGKQAGDPVRAAQAMIDVTEAPNPPRHLVLGAWGHDAATKKLKQRLDEIHAWRETALATDYPKDLAAQG